ncbi:MAG: glycosyltransferase family 2 protein [Selenomonadaceae bacterium]|nr:glycosyltransferase family 2 protein [Selenomonadaceae bacterium]
MKISVIIPMFNAEKYVSECLDSLLAQTLQDFEVIVVDDCSTDNSVAVVKSYAEKFGGRLRLARTEKNSGGGAVPRNLALPLSRGEYISFLDADDAITPTAFEELYGTVKNFDADVLSCERFYLIPDALWNNPAYRKNLQPYNWRGGEFLTEPALLPEDLSVRAKLFHQRYFMNNVWSKLFRRDFILENELDMSDIPIAEDMVFTLCTLCSAKGYVVVPNVVNYYRVRENSVTTERIDIYRHLIKWLHALRLGFRYIDDFLSGREYFSRNTEEKYLLLETYAQEMFRYFVGTYSQIPAHKLDEIIRKEFSKGDDVALTTFMFSTLNIYRIRLAESLQRTAELEKKLSDSLQRTAELEKISSKKSSRRKHK